MCRPHDLSLRHDISFLSDLPTTMPFFSTFGTKTSFVIRNNRRNQSLPYVQQQPTESCWLLWLGPSGQQTKLLPLFEKRNSPLDVTRRLLIYIPPPTRMTGPHRLVILYGIGGLSDVGRHAVQVAVDLMQHPQQPSKEQRSGSTLSEVVVLTKYPDLLKEPNWNCGCPEPHAVDLNRIKLVPVKAWNDPGLAEHFAGGSSTAVVSCVGNRQPGVGGNDAHESMEQLILPAMKQHAVSRLVVMTSVGVEEDWPALEFFAMGRYVLSCMFLTVSRRAFRDLTKMERAVRQGTDAALDFLLVRPVGIGEDVLPAGKWQLQSQKYKDVLHFDMAKLDVARFMVQEALRPKLHRTAVVIGAVKDEAQAQEYREDFLSRE